MRSRRSSFARGAALVLTAVAGFVDAMGYLALLHVYTANMSGNSVTVGMDAARGQWRESVRRFLPIAAFFLGLLLAGIVIEAGRNWGVTRRVSLALAIEAVCLLIFVVKYFARLFSRSPQTRRADSSLKFLTGLWVLYVAGAAAGGAAWAYVGTVAMLAPAALVLAVIAVDLSHPLGRSRVKQSATSPVEGCHA